MEVKEGKNQEALKSLIPLAELARQRQGNIGYDVYSSTENPNELVLDGDGLAKQHSTNIIIVRRHLKFERQ